MVGTVTVRVGKNTYEGYVTFGSERGKVFQTIHFGELRRTDPKCYERYDDPRMKQGAAGVLLELVKESATDRG